MQASPDDYCWLVSSAAADWLHEAAAAGPNLVAATARLRKGLSAERTHLVLEQAELRRRAKSKFELASSMFFTPIGLEQASDSIIARYKAQRFGDFVDVTDLCCGIGGDLLALAQLGQTVGVDRDVAVSILAEANLRVAAEAVEPGASLRRGESFVVTGEVTPRSVDDCGAWHLDPDRRPAGRRTTHVELAEPSPAAIDALRDVQPNGAVKLAPASDVPDDWSGEAELEWISRGGECRQLVVWFGRLASAVGQRRATALDKLGGAASICGPVSGEPPRAPVAAQLGRYLFEPDAAVLAAELVGTLANDFSLRSIAPGAVYLTGDSSMASALLTPFEIQEVLPLDLKRIKALVRARGIGQLEVKKRGVDHDPAAIQKQLRGPGSERATLILTRIKDDAIAILARRVE